MNLISEQDARPTQKKTKHETKLNHIALIVGPAILATLSAQAADKKPNILVIWGDDIGWPAE
jgi:hypothetical protein